MGVLHVNQTVDRKHVGCADTIFATQETIAKPVREGSTVHIRICVYTTIKKPLQFSVLLNCLFSLGVDGKTWSIIKNWYKGGSACVKPDNKLSAPFSSNRGVREGSVLWPTLLLLVMNPVLKCLESTELGLKIGEQFLGGFAHADDIRTLTNNLTTLKPQTNRNCILVCLWIFLPLIP